MLGRGPAAYATENLAAEDKTIIAHYFSGGAEYYIAEMWHEPGGEGGSGRWMTFGYAKLASQPRRAGMGYLDLNELEHVRGHTPQGLPVFVERHMHRESPPFSVRLPGFPAWRHPKRAIKHGTMH